MFTTGMRRRVHIVNGRHVAIYHRAASDVRLAGLVAVGPCDDIPLQPAAGNVACVQFCTACSFERMTPPVTFRMLLSSFFTAMKPICSTSPPLMVSTGLRWRRCHPRCMDEGREMPLVHHLAAAISNVPWLSITYQLLPPLCDALVLASELRVSMPPRMTACAPERFTNAPLA